MTDDRSYFLTRAEDELKLARRATHQKAARAHFLLAGAYFDRAFGPHMLEREKMTNITAS